MYSRGQKPEYTRGFTPKLDDFDPDFLNELCGNHSSLSFIIRKFFTGGFFPLYIFPLILYVSGEDGMESKEGRSNVSVMKSLSIV